MGYVYCITSPSGKKYIGQTINSVAKRFAQHCQTHDCRALYGAIQKYGKEQLSIETLIEVNNQLLDYYETKFITMYDTMVPNGYNIRSGGSTGLHCEQSRQLMREAKLGDKNHNFGKPRTDICKMRIGEAKKGEKHHFYGKELSDNHKKMLSLSHKRDSKVSESSLPMYLVRIKARPEHYSASGYAVINHPNLPARYFTSKKLTDDQKKELALQYLTNMDAVQRLNDSGC